MIASVLITVTFMVSIYNYHVIQDNQKDLKQLKNKHCKIIEEIDCEEGE